MRKLILFISIILLGILPILANAKLQSTHEARLIPLNGIAAVVNHDIITDNQLANQMAIVKQRLQATNIPMPAPNVLRKQVLDHLIYQHLALQLAKRNNLTVNNAQLNQAIAGIAQRNGISVQQLKQKVESEGSTYAQFRQTIRDEMLINQIEQQAVGPSINVSNAEVQTYLKDHQAQDEEYNLDNILIPIPNNPTPQQIQAAQQRAQSLVKKLQAGGNFRQIAVAESGGQQALQGGSLGWRRPAALPTVFAKKVVNMKIGAVAGPIKAPNGFHIIKLIGKRKAGSTLTATQVKELLYQRKFEQKLVQWMQQIRAAAFVKIMPSP